MYVHLSRIKRRRRSKLGECRGEPTNQKMFKCRVVEMPSPTVSINKSKGKCSRQLFILPICRVLGKLKHNTGSLHEEKLRCSVVLSFTFAAFIRPWTQNGILESVRRKSLKNLTISQLRACVFASRKLRPC